MIERVLACGVGEEQTLLGVLQRRMPIHFDGDVGATTGGTELSWTDTVTGRRLVLQARSAMAGSSEPTEHRCRVEFADDPDVPQPYRHREVEVLLPDAAPGLSLQAGERVLAHAGERVLWTVSQALQLERYRAALPLPQLPKGGSFCDIFNTHRCVAALCLLAYLRKVCARHAWTAPPLRAAFVIDDPNLHWPRYGPLDFRELAARARSGRYHVAIATVPLDAWFVHADAARVFREHRRELSLLVHGNDHAYHELSRPRSAIDRERLLAQALARIRHLEQRGGLAVSRVMVPPHGACSAVMLRELPRHGFEAACLSSGSLRAHNPHVAGLAGLGLDLAERIEGCPVLPRWAVDSHSRQAALAGTYLGQALIFRTHAKDLRHGLEPLDDLASFIRQLGAERWEPLHALARSNFEGQLSGDTLTVRPFGLRHEIELPVGVQRLRIEPSWGEASGTWCWQHGLASGWARPGESVAIGPSALGQALRLERPLPVSARAAAVIARRGSAPPLHLLLRRLATEARDRLMFTR